MTKRQTSRCFLALFSNDFDFLDFFLQLISDFDDNRIVEKKSCFLSLLRFLLFGCLDIKRRLEWFMRHAAQMKIAGWKYVRLLRVGGPALLSKTQPHTTRLFVYHYSLIMHCYFSCDRLRPASSWNIVKISKISHFNGKFHENRRLDATSTINRKSKFIIACIGVVRAQ